MRMKQAKRTEGEMRKAMPPQVNEAAMVIPFIREEIIVDKQVVETGKVRISKRISEHEKCAVRGSGHQTHCQKRKR